MGASYAFEAALDRYSREDYILLTYHVHIPLPDPMTNPSTVQRQAWYGVRSTPSYFIDGESGGGGGSAEMSKSIFETKVEPGIKKHLEDPGQAKIDLRVTPIGSTVKVRTKVSNLTSKSDKLRLHLVLVEEETRYSGENGVRFHEMTVRGLAVPPVPPVKDKTKAAASAKPAADGKPAADAKATDDAKPAPPPQGFALKPGKGGSFEYTFDLAKLAADAKGHLDEFETNRQKNQPEFSFRERKHEIDAAKLAVVAFVQDEATKKVLQAVFVKPAGAKKTTN